MLIRFVVSNYLSFKEETEINMLASAVKSHPHHVYDSGKVQLVKAGAIYGANASGKSNLIKAIDALRSQIKQGFILPNSEAVAFRFKEKDEQKPICFEIEFLINETMYHYGLEIQSNQVQQEWLIKRLSAKKEIILFERKRDSVEWHSSMYKNANEHTFLKLGVDKLVQPNHVLLSHVLIKDKNPIKEVLNFLLNELILIYPQSNFTAYPLILSLFDKESVEFGELISLFDTGMTSLELKEIDFNEFSQSEQLSEAVKSDLQKRVTTEKKSVFQGKWFSYLLVSEGASIKVYAMQGRHQLPNGLSEQFFMHEESDGTRRILDLIPILYLLQKKSYVFIIDEIERSLHPSLIKQLVETLLKTEDLKGQLIFTTHESNLLDLTVLRSDEIWFMEKDPQTGASDCYSLTSFKPRVDLDIEKGYLNGRFGAIPFLGNLRNLTLNDLEYA